VNAGLLTAAGLSWQRSGDVIASVVYNGRQYSVMIPSSSVRFHIQAAAQAEGLALPQAVGDVDIIGWFGSSLLKKATKAGRSLYRKAKKVARRTVRAVRKTAKAAASGGHALWGYARKAVNSKELGYLVLASAAVCPAIGGPAFMALQTAKRVSSALDQGGAVARQVASNVRSLAAARNPTPFQNLMLSALRSR
jgi:hypothetical protein